MQQFIDKVYYSTDYNRENAHKNYSPFLFDGGSVPEYLNMSSISARSASSKKSLLHLKYNNYTLSTAILFTVRPYSVLFQDGLNGMNF